jgi:haloalkane dehalogenase
MTSSSPQESLRTRIQALDGSLYPFDSHFFERNGIRLHYLDEGPRSDASRAETVVMLHGNPSWSIYYRELTKALRDTYRCIVPDHIGCGLSDKPGDDRYAYTLEQRAGDLEALLDHLALTEDLTLVLHDWGGMIGMVYASRHPQRVKRLVILNTSAFRLPKPKPFPWQLWLTRTPLGALLVRGFNIFSRSTARACCKRKPMSLALRRAYAAPYDSWANRIATLRFVQDIPLRPGDRGYDLVREVEEGLGRFKNTPMLICWGEKDFVFDRHFLAEWERAFPDAELHRFPDCGHYILEDAGAEIIPLVRDFLEKHSVGGGTGRTQES